MKKNDLILVLIACVLIFPFIPLEILKTFHTNILFNDKYWAITSFLKFALLATFGEVIGLRIKTGEIYQKGFGLLPRAMVWGFLGIFIKMAFIVFAVGTPVVLEKLFGLPNAISCMGKDIPDVFSAFENQLGFTRLITAFSISALLNLIFAPVFMTFHKITDTHIINNNGTLKGFFTPIQFGKIFPSLNWFVQWDFIFKKTIPFFWIPAHTITFLMPAQYQISFAALLGIVLGVIMAISSRK